MICLNHKTVTRSEYNHYDKDVGNKIFIKTALLIKQPNIFRNSYGLTRESSEHLIKSKKF